MSNDASALHPIERSILRSLTNEPILIETLAEKTGLSMDQVRRGVEWLKFKNLISVKEVSDSLLSLASEGKAAVQSGLPERRLIKAILQGKNAMANILASGLLNGQEVNAAVAGARRNGWIQFSDGNKMSATKQADKQSIEELLLAKMAAGDVDLATLSADEKKGYESLKKRPGYIESKERKQVLLQISESGSNLLSLLSEERPQERRVTGELITSGRWKDLEFSALDVEAAAPAVFPGRKHPLVDIIDEVKEIFVGLGFSEIDGDMVQSGFWNFDALFTPQDHPAREMQDTFYISKTRHPVPASEDQISKISQVHKSGWGSWNQEESSRVVLRTHTTPVTLRHLASIKPETGRYFSVGRVFRNEKVSYKHLVEFHQVEGVVTAKGASIRDLMGLQKEFYAKMEIKKIKFWPTFFPYTEPSLQTMVYNERLQKWVELFGMGIFRPEVTKPLGIKNPVLAWGGGLERIAMLRFGLDDVRELYTNRLGWLRSVPRCQL